MKIDIEKIINKLIDKNELFISERDFQNKFINLVDKIYNNDNSLSFYSEYPYPINSKDKLDLVIFDIKRKEYSVIEFKYILQGGKMKMPGNDHWPFRTNSPKKKRIDACKKDIKRLKTIDLNSKMLDIDKRNNFKKGSCYFILLTNHKGILEEYYPNEYKTYSTNSEFKYLVKKI